MKNKNNYIAIGFIFLLWIIPTHIPWTINATCYWRFYDELHIHFPLKIAQMATDENGIFKVSSERRPKTFDIGFFGANGSTISKPRISEVSSFVFLNAFRPRMDSPFRNNDAPDNRFILREF